METYQKSCDYNYNALTDGLWLYPLAYAKLIHIDDGIAYVDDLSEATPLEAYGVTLSETVELDERYEFTHQIDFQMNGYHTADEVPTDNCVILKTNDGNLWMMNVQMPLKVEYSYTLSDEADSTTFTLSAISNFPMLRVSGATVQEIHSCEYHNKRIKSLFLNENNFSTIAGTVIKYTNDGFKEVDGSNVVYTEQYDGETLQHSLSFNLSMGAYKSSFHYNLLEFQENKYVAVLQTYDGVQYALGFNGHGLQPSYEISGDRQSISNIAISLSDRVSTRAFVTSSTTFTPLTTLEWRYTADYNGYECLSNGVGKFLLKEEVDQLGNKSGRYQCLEGYEEYFTFLNIVGTFSTTETFATSQCYVGGCRTTCSLPNELVFYGVNTFYFAIESDSDWSIAASGVTVSPSSGEGGTLTTFTVTNTANTETSGLVRVNHCDILVEEIPVTIHPSSVECLPNGATRTIDARGQSFAARVDCPLLTATVASQYSDAIGVVVSYGKIVVTVAANSSSNARSLPITLTFQDGSQIVYTVTQNGAYSEWDVDGYMCSGGSKYEVERWYSGGSQSFLQPTNITRIGQLVESASTYCESVDYQYVITQDTYCDNGREYQVLMEEVSRDQGETWDETGMLSLGSPIGTCTSETYEYEWVLNTAFTICSDDAVQTPKKLYMTYYQGPDFELDCTTSFDLLPSETHPMTRQFDDITSAEIGGCVTHIQDGAFEGARRLSSVTFGSNVVYIGNRAFSGCGNLENLELGSSVSAVGYNAFANCSSLKNISTESLGVIPANFANNCLTLQTVTLNDGITSIGQGAFQNCRTMWQINIPESVTSIGEEAFNGCGTMRSFTIPSGVTAIGDRAFSGCGYLTAIYVEAVVPPIIGDDVFSNTSYCDIYVPCAYLDAYKEAWPEWEDRLVGNDCKKVIMYYNGEERYAVACGYNLELTEDETHPSSRTFENISSVTFGNCVTSIGQNAFKGATSLNYMPIPSNIEGIGENAFSGAVNLEKVEFKYASSLYAIGQAAFAVISGMTSADLRWTNVTSLNVGVFAANTIKNILLPSRLSTISSSAFEQSYLHYFDVPAGVSVISNHAFYQTGNNKLSEITFWSYNCPSVAEDAFYLGAYSMSNPLIIYVPNGRVTAYRDALPSVIGTSTATQINGADWRCSVYSETGVDHVDHLIAQYIRRQDVSGLTNFNDAVRVRIDDGCNEVRDGAFSGMTHLREVEISSGCATIGQKAFADNPNLEMVISNYNGASFTGWNTTLFDNCPNLQVIYVPENRAADYRHYLTQYADIIEENPLG